MIMSAVGKMFVIIDDDPINNLITKMSLRKSIEEAQVIDFIDPEVGLEYIQTEFQNKEIVNKTTIFLDINMPKMNGWEFLEKFDQLTISVKRQFDIYILSSSVDNRDMQKATSNPLVTDFIEKPLTKALLQKMFG